MFNFFTFCPNISTINSNIDLKANKSDIYNKSEIDSKLSTINSNIQLKANTIDVDNKLLLKSDLDYVNSNISSINNNLDLKANIIKINRQVKNILCRKCTHS